MLALLLALVACGSDTEPSTQNPQPPAPPPEDLTLPPTPPIQLPWDPAGCGDGVVQGDEACDDGNAIDTDDCMNGCRAPEPLTRTVGPILLKPAPRRPVVSVYLVSPGGERQAEVAVDRIGSPGGAGEAMGDPYPSSANIALVRVFEPGEALRHWHYQRQEPGSPSPSVIASPTEPPPPSFQFDAAGNTKGYRVSLRQAGIYELRVATNSLKTAVRVRLPDGVGYGVSQQNGAFAWPYCLDTCLPVAATSLYAFAPRHPTARMFLELTANGSSSLPTVRATGAPEPMTPVKVDGSERYELSPGASDEGVVWQLDFQDSNKVQHFHATGIPLILCDSAASADAIRASTVRVPSGPHKGTLVSHRFQSDILELLPELLEPSNVGDEALTTALDGPAFTAAPAKPPCAGTGSGNGPGALTPDQAYQSVDLLHSYDSPLKAVRWYLSRGSVSSNGVVTYGAGAPMLELSPSSHFGGAIGLPLLERQRCREAMECVSGGACRPDGTCDVAFDPSVNRWDVLRGVRYKVRDNAQYYDSYTALGLPGAAARHLMLAATLAHPCNPWGPATKGAPPTHPELVARAAAHGLAELLVVGEDERQLSVGDTDPYPGSAGFQLVQFAENFGAVAGSLPKLLPGAGPKKDLGERLQRVWATGLRRLIDRHQSVYMTTTMNQSSTFMLATEELARGSEGLPFAALYRQVAREYGQRFAAEASATGWLAEASGPSSSYAGMQHWHMARYLGLTESDPEGEDLVVRDALAASYRFFSRFAVEEPDGQRSSGFNYAHRIGVGFELEQYQGARGQAETVPEVALWSEWHFPQSGKKLEQALGTVKSLAGGFGGPVDAIPRLSLTGSPEVGLELDSTKRPALPILPANQVGDAEVLLPDVGSGKPPEILTVRRGRYYTALFIGNPAPRYAYAGHFETTRMMPLKKGTLTIEDIDPTVETGNVGGATTTHAIDLYEQSPMIGGGLSLLAVPGYGSALLATNWSPLTHHGLVVERDELIQVGTKRRYWEDYEQVTTDRTATGPGGDCARLFPQAEHLTLPAGFTVYGRIEGQPQDKQEALPLLYPNLCYARHYTFASDRVGVRIVLKRSAAASGGATTRIFENIPIPTCTRNVCNAVTQSGGTLNRKSKGASLAFDPVLGSERVRVRDSATPKPRGFDLAFPPGRTVTLRPHGLRFSYYGEELQVGRVEVELVVPASEGASTSLDYELVPVD
ncbi:MAG: hypothetical protein FJ095_19250 [Deltaproteobacteria bacterium]|nr:hypothetical protein [Deltaproteobacteria bacterium]